MKFTEQELEMIKFAKECMLEGDYKTLLEMGFDVAHTQGCDPNFRGVGEGEPDPICVGTGSDEGGRDVHFYSYLKPVTPKEAHILLRCYGYLKITYPTCNGEGCMACSGLGMIEECGP